MPCNTVHLSALSKTRSQAIKLLIAPCEDADVAMTDKSVFTPGVLGAVYSVLQFGSFGGETVITFNLGRS